MCCAVRVCAKPLSECAPPMFEVRIASSERGDSGFSASCTNTRTNTIHQSTSVSSCSHRLSTQRAITNQLPSFFAACKVIVPTFISCSNRTRTSKGLGIFRNRRKRNPATFTFTNARQCKRCHVSHFTSFRTHSQSVSEPSTMLDSPSR